MLDKVFGNDMETKCAWCLEDPVSGEYIGLMGGDEYVLYQVCDKCYIDSPNLESYNLNDVEKYATLNKREGASK
jgi:hypothetical protein